MSKRAEQSWSDREAPRRRRRRVRPRVRRAADRAMISYGMGLGLCAFFLMVYWTYG